MPEEGSTAATAASTADASASADNQATTLLAGQVATTTAGDGTTAGEGADQATTQTDTQAGKSDEKAGAPEAYEFKAPEGMTLDQAAVEVFTPILKKHSVSAEAAQEMVDVYASIKANDAKAQQEAAAKQQQAWTNDVQTDKEFGGEKLEASLRDANIALSKFATPEEIKAIQEVGAANFPPLVKLLARVGALMGEDKLRAGGPTASDGKALGQKFYPGMNP